MGNYKFGMADMKAGRWQQVKQLFAAAEKLSVEERTSFLRQACPNDPELQRYLESCWSGTIRLIPSSNNSREASQNQSHLPPVK